MKEENPLPRLELPKRWELLVQRAAEEGLDVREFVERVDEAANRIDLLLNRVRTGGSGLFEIFLGLPGSGKTTFLNTLPKFFSKIKVFPFAPTQPLHSLPEFVRSTHVAGDDHSRVVIVERRDIPKAAEVDAAEQLFADLLYCFREPAGTALILWPITKADAAQKIAATAWEAGRDIIADPSTKGCYQFRGVSKEKYFELADNTTRNLTGDGLEAFGVDPASASNLLPGCETIADFFAKVDAAAASQRDKTWSVLKERARVHCWVALPGDDIAALTSTVAALTQGTRSRVDVDRIGEFLDKPENKALYVADWRERRASLAHTLRAIDVRLFSVPPNVALAAIRSFGDESLTKVLKQASANLEQSKKAMRASRLYKAILQEAGIETAPFAGNREIKPETREEYNRVQALAARSDKALNKALGSLIAACLADDMPSAVVVSERRSLPNSELQPDIQIEIGKGNYICLEPTWRSTRKGQGGGKEPAQSTLSEGFIQKYLLDKAMQYVRDLEL